jgi:DNA-binding transcriptional LysR family regulator
MTPDRLDWTLVRSFLAVLDAGSLMGAARRLAVQQSTLSRHVAELESQLGAPLFERTGRGVTPTALALLIAEPARQMQDGAETLARSASGWRDASSGTVRVTASTVASNWLLPPLLADLAAAEPGIAIELVASNGLSNLLRREADIAVRMVRPQQSSLVARKLGEVGIGAYAHRRYLDVAGAPASAAELPGHRLIGLDSDDLILRGFAAMGLPVARDAFQVRCDDQVAYIQLVAAGAGIGFIAHYCARQLPGLVRVLPELAIPPLPCWLAVHREIRGKRIVRRVFDHLAAALPAMIRDDLPAERPMGA